MKRHWFLIAMVPVLLLGAFLPQGGPVIREHLVLPLVAVILFISGFTMDARNAVRQALNVRAGFVSLGSCFVVAPALGYLLARLIGPALAGPDSPGFLFLQATMIAAAQASTLATAIVFTGIARGDRELALVLTLLSNGLTAIVTPVVLWVAIGASVRFPVAEMMGRLGLVIILPMLAGLVTRLFVWRRPGRAMAAIGIVPQLIILTFMYTAFSSAATRLATERTIGLRFLGVCAALHGLMLLWTATVARVAGLAREQRPAVIFSGSQKTVPNGIYLWSTFFPGNPYGAVPLVLHQIIQLVAGNVLAARLGRVAPRASTTSSAPTRGE